MSGARDADRTVFERACDGEPVLDELVEQHLPKLRAYVRAHLNAELRRRESTIDLVQSVCRVVLAERERFDFQGEPQFRAWLFTSALNKIREKHRFYRTPKRDVRQEAEGVEHDRVLVAGYETVQTPSQMASAAEQIARLETALDELSDDHREVIALARLVELPIDLVAERMGRTAEATRMLLGRALVKIARAMKRLESGDSAT